MIRLGISGGRDITDPRLVDAAIVCACGRLGVTTQDIAIVVGDCPRGVDLFAREWAQVNDRPLSVHVAQWQRFRLSAGPRRNLEIIRDCDFLVTIPSAKSRGTWNAYRSARGVGLDVLLYHTNGRWIHSVGTRVLCRSNDIAKIPVAGLPPRG